jgi:CRISPR-associated protein Cas1
VGYHTVTIDVADCFLGCKSGQLICRTDEGEKSLPLEDVASILVTGFSGTVHSELLLECATRGIPLIFCRAFRPTALVYPSNRSTDTLLTRAHLGLGKKDRMLLWDATVTAKCRNQFVTASSFSDQKEALDGMRSTAWGKNPHREGTVARSYWGLWGASLHLEGFLRERSAEGANQLLNYGYAVLLSSILQKLFAVGVDPSIGISHVVRERSDTLAYDLMEPFRVLVDAKVGEWIRNLGDATPEVNREFRSFIVPFLKDRISYQGVRLDVTACIEAVVLSFRRAILAGKIGFYRPWILND